MNSQNSLSEQQKNQITPLRVADFFVLSYNFLAEFLFFLCDNCHKTSINRGK